MVGTTAPRQHADPRGRPLRSPLLLLLVLLAAIVVVLAGCGGDDEETAADGSSTTTVTSPGATTTTGTVTTTAEATTTSADTTPTQPVAPQSPPTVPTTGAVPTTGNGLTIEDLEQALVVAIADRVPDVGPGQLTCQGSGPLSPWRTVRCGFIPDEPREFGPVYVSVFDGGRYGWVTGGCCDSEPEPSAYPSGLYCRDLVVQPPGSYDDRDFYHLSYGAAVYYWLNDGRPDRMDADGDGEPCETVYPADEVARYWSLVRMLEPAS